MVRRVPRPPRPAASQDPRRGGRRIVERMDAPVPVLEPVLPRRGRRRGPAAPAIALPAVAFVVACLALSGDTREPARSPWLAVVDPSGALVTMDAAGGTIESIDAPGVTFQFPAWSPDGSHIAAIGGSRSFGAVYVLDAAAATEPGDDGRTVLYTSPDQRPFYLSWSPDSERVSFLTNEASGGIALRTAPADAAEPAEVVRRAAPFYWDWIDPGRLIVHTGGSGPESFIGEVGLDGAALETSSIEPGFFRSPTVAAGGRYRAYVATARGTDQAIVLEARGASVRHEIPVTGSIAISFAPAGPRLAFVASDREVAEPPPLPIGPLRVVNAESGAVTILRDGPVVAFFWSPDGRSIALLEFIESEGPAVEEARIGPAMLAAAVAEPRGVALRLAFVDVASGAVRSERDVRVTELFAFQLLPFFDQYALSHRVWSPDSDAIVLPVAGDGGLDQVAVIPIDGSAPRLVADGSMAFWRP